MDWEEAEWQSAQKCASSSYDYCFVLRIIKPVLIQRKERAPPPPPRAHREQQQQRSSTCGNPRTPSRPRTLVSNPDAKTTCRLVQPDSRAKWLHIYILCCRSDMSRTWIRHLEIFVHWFCPVGKRLQSRCQDDVSSCVAHSRAKELHVYCTSDMSRTWVWHLNFFLIGSAPFGSDFNPDAKMTCRCV